MMYKYSVLCFIVNNYEKVREIQNPDSEVEYILVTDNKNIKSDTWKVIYDEKLVYMQPYEKCAVIKYDLFRYCSSDICVYIDGSIQIKDSLDQLVIDFDQSNSDIALLSHPTIFNIVNELQLWIKLRGYSHIQANKYMNFLNKHGYNFEYKSHFQSGLSIRRNSKITHDFQMLVLSHLYYISDDNNFERVDQFMQDFVLNTYFNDKKIFLLSLQCLQSKMFQICKHNSDEKNKLDIDYDLTKDEYTYCFNKLQKTYYIR